MCDNLKLDLVLSEDDEPKIKVRKQIKEKLATSKQQEIHNFVKQTEVQMGAGNLTGPKSTHSALSGFRQCKGHSGSGVVDETRVARYYIH